MGARWKETIDRALGDRRTRFLGVLLILVGVLGKLVLLRYANIETVFVASLLAGSLLGRWWTVLVPMTTMLLLEPFLWGNAHVDYALDAVFGVTFFVITGFVFVGLTGRAVRPRILFRVGAVSLLTTISVPLTIAFDVWTDIGDYYFVFRPMGTSFWTVLQNQVPFTLYHLLSSILFVPLFGTLFLLLHYHLADAPAIAASPEEEG
jgi:hypothetical protein